MIKQTITIAFCVIIGIYVLFGIFLTLIFRAMARKNGDGFSVVDAFMITFFWPTVIKWSTERTVEEQSEKKEGERM